MLSRHYFNLTFKPVKSNKLVEISRSSHAVKSNSFYYFSKLNNWTNTWKWLNEYRKTTERIPKDNSIQRISPPYHFSILTLKFRKRINLSMWKLCQHCVISCSQDFCTIVEGEEKLKRMPSIIYLFQEGGIRIAEKENIQRRHLIEQKERLIAHNFWSANIC